METLVKNKYLECEREPEYDPKVIKILLLEDNEDDVLLTRRILDRNGINYELTPVRRVPEYKKYLESDDFDLILADFHLPGFNGFDALKFYQDSGCDKPFIFVSGTIGDENAVEALKSGAADYVFKDNLKKLPVAINKAMLEYQKSLDKLNAEREKNKLIKDLKRHNDELQNFVNIISHNLRGPVASLRGLVYIFNSENYGDEINLKIIKEIEEKCIILNETLTDLKESITRLDDSEPERELVDLKHLIENIKKILFDQFHGQESVIKTDFNECKKVVTNKSYLFNILYNLITNGIKHSIPGKKPEILISSRKDNKNYIISVKDNGIGMDFNKIDKEKIFGFYQRFNMQTEGKGLGLYLVKRQVESLNGAIKVKSKPGEGSTFTVYLNR